MQWDAKNCNVFKALINSWQKWKVWWKITSKVESILTYEGCRCTPPELTFHTLFRIQILYEGELFFVQNPNIIWRTFIPKKTLELFSLITKYYQNFDSKHYQKSSRITRESFPCSDSKYHHNSLSLILEELFIVQNPNKYDYKRRNRSKK